MKKTLLFLLTIAAIVTSCKKEDVDVEDIHNRLSQLEVWQQKVNSQVAPLQGIVSAYETEDFVTSVTPLTDKTGYVINFQKSGTITIKHGDKASTPILSTKKETNGNYYWTLDGEWLMNGTAKMLVSSTTPQVRINTISGMWEVSTDGGTTWKATNVKAQGGAIFANSAVDDSYANEILFTLVDGVTLPLPRYKEFKIGTDESNDAYKIVHTQNIIIPLTLPSGFKESDYTAMMAQVMSDQGTGTSVVTRAATSASSPWQVSVNKPTFTDGVYNNDASVTIKAPADIASDEKAMLQVTIVDNNGGTLVAIRPLIATNLISIGDYYYSDGTYSTAYDNSKTAVGLIYFIVPNQVQVVCRIVSITESDSLMAWGPTDVTTNANDGWDGARSMADVMALDNDFSNYPAFKYAHDQNPVGTTYSAYQRDVWFVPSIYELRRLFAVYTQSSDMFYPVTNQAAKDEFNAKLTTAGGTTLSTDNYWSATERDMINVWYVSYTNGATFASNKERKYRVRLIKEVIIVP